MDNILCSLLVLEVGRANHLAVVEEGEEDHRLLEVAEVVEAVGEEASRDCRGADGVLCESRGGRRIAASTG